MKFYPVLSHDLKSLNSIQLTQLRIILITTLGLVISHSNKKGLMRKPLATQGYLGKRAGGEHPDEAMSSKRWSTAF